jgi:hypothetical protein
LRRHGSDPNYGGVEVAVWQKQADRLRLILADVRLIAIKLYDFLIKYRFDLGNATEESKDRHFKITH